MTLYIFIFIGALSTFLIPFMTFAIWHLRKIIKIYNEIVAQPKAMSKGVLNGNISMICSKCGQESGLEMKSFDSISVQKITPTVTVTQGVKNEN